LHDLFLESALYSGAFVFSCRITCVPKVRNTKKETKSAGIRAHSKRFAGIGASDWYQASTDHVALLLTEFSKAPPTCYAERPREAFGAVLYSGAFVFSCRITLRPEKFARLKKETKSAGIRTHSKRFAGSGR